MHLFFSCEYAKIVWFVSFLGLRVDGLLQQGCTTIPDMIDQILRTCSQEGTLEFIFTMLWMLWKSINDLPCNSKHTNPLQVIYGEKALIAIEEPDKQPKDLPREDPLYKIVYSSDRSRILRGPNIFVDAAWNAQNHAISPSTGPTKSAGLGVFIYAPSHPEHISTIFLQATSLAGNALQAEARALDLASMVASKLQLQQHANYFTDNETLAMAAAARKSKEKLGHWVSDQVQRALY